MSYILILFTAVILSTAAPGHPAQVQSPTKRDPGSEVQGQPPTEMQPPADPRYSDTQGVREPGSPTYGDATQESTNRRAMSWVWLVLVLAVVGAFVPWMSRRRRGMPTGSNGNPRI